MATKRTRRNQRASVFLLAAVIAFPLLEQDLAAQLTVGPACTANRPPVAKNDEAMAFPGVAVTIRVLDNDTDPDKNPLTISSATQPAHGVVVISTGKTVTYKSFPGFTGADHFTYVIKDGVGGEASASVTVAVGKFLVLAYGFNEPEPLIPDPTHPDTSVRDSSNFGNHGTISGGVTRAIGHSGLFDDGARHFDGVSGLITVADDDATLDLRQMTLEAWVKPGALTGWRSVIVKEIPGIRLVYGLYANSDASGPGAYIRVNSFNHNATRALKLPADGNWHHLAATYDGTVLSLYVDGAQAASVGVSGSIAVSDLPLYIGGNKAWGEFFDGLIDDVRVYNYPLTAAQIQADMNAPVR